jgi:hypothetical protein
MNPDHDAVARAASQGGVLRREQALDCGLTSHQIDQRLRDGRWLALGKHGYRLIDLAEPFDLVRAAIATLPNAVVSHQAAAALHHMAKVPSDVPSVTVDAGTTHDFPGVVVHRNRDLVEIHVVELRGLPITTIARTVVDLAAVLTPRHLAGVVDEAVAAGQTSIGALSETLEGLARRGKPGVRALRSVLAYRSSGPPRGSFLERLGAKVLAEGGMPEPHFEFAISWDPERRFDAAYPDRRLAIEWDSQRWHLQVDRFQRDRERDRKALLHGWRVLRFTWEDLTDRPHDVVETVRRALELEPINPGL